MGRLQKIEDLVAGSLVEHANLKLLTRGRPRYLDPQLTGGIVRYAVKQGFNFTAIAPDNQVSLQTSAKRRTNRLTLKSRPQWFRLNALIRVGTSWAIGEMHTIGDLIDDTAIDTNAPLLQNYSASQAIVAPNFVTLLGTQARFFGVALSPNAKRVFLIETQDQVVPGDVLLMAATPEILESLAEYELKRVKFLSYTAGNPGIGEPAVLYRYEVEIKTPTGLLPFTPEEDLKIYLKAQPLYHLPSFEDGGDVAIPNGIGPFLLDAFSGALQFNIPVGTRLGIKTYDSFGTQLNSSLVLPADQDWQIIKPNHLILDRSIRANNLLFWQKINGNFQFKRAGIFQAELDDQGRFVMSTDILVPAWPSDRQVGWVIPVTPQGSIRMTFQFEPQEQQIFDLPSATISFVRPKIVVDPAGTPVRRLVVSILGTPGARVEIRDWGFDGNEVTAVSYYMLGAGEGFGQNKWLAGGFSAKPLFYDINVLRAAYSDGSSRYDHGFLYS